MSKFDKLLRKILKLSKDLRFEELSSILIYFGYEMRQPSGGSSHYVFRKKNCRSITIPKHSPIKTVYVKMVKEIIEEG